MQSTDPTHTSPAYQPPITDITDAFQRARATYTPMLTGIRLDRAETILRDITPRAQVHSPDGSWSLHGEHGNVYHVSAAGCTCPDYRRHAPHAPNRYYCKHLLAWYAWRRCIITQLNRLDPTAAIPRDWYRANASLITPARAEPRPEETPSQREWQPSLSVTEYRRLISCQA